MNIGLESVFDGKTTGFAFLDWAIFFFLVLIVWLAGKNR